METSQFTVRHRLLVVPACVLLTLILGACSPGPAQGPAASAPATAPKLDPELVKAIPESIAAAGVIQVGTSATYEPMIYRKTQGGPIVGVDVELFDAVAAKFGLRTEWTSADFGDLLTGITNGTYDVGASSITVTPERAETMKLVSYLNSGTRWAVTGNNPLGVDPAQACGLAIGVTSGSKYETEDLPARNRSCPRGQKIKIVSFKGADEGMAAVKFGRADAMVADDAVISYQVARSGGAMQLVGDLYDKSQLGYGLPETDEAFANALAKALQEVKADGTYGEILARWGLSSSAIEKFQVSS